MLANPTQFFGLECLVGKTHLLQAFEELINSIIISQVLSQQVGITSQAFKYLLNKLGAHALNLSSKLLHLRLQCEHCRGILAAAVMLLLSIKLHLEMQLLPLLLRLDLLPLPLRQGLAPTHQIGCLIDLVF